MTTTEITLDDILQAISGVGRQVERLSQQVEAIEQRMTALEQAVAEDEADEALWDEAFAQSPDALAKLADEARAERQAGRTTELEPDLL